MLLNDIFEETGAIGAHSIAGARGNLFGGDAKQNLISRNKRNKKFHIQKIQFSSNKQPIIDIPVLDVDGGSSD